MPCTSDNTSSSYQKVENITLSNNTIINTNAPLFYNTDKGSTDPTGTVSNNLIYFTPSNPNVSDVLTGDTSTSYANLGTALTYSGNVYTGTNLGETNAGFTEQAGIIATADGEIYTFSGPGATGKGADMGGYTPTTDDMVGHGIGACFLDNLGAMITDGDCTVEIPESLTVSNLPTLSPDAGSYDVSVVTNVSWTAVSNDAWISIDVTAASGDETVLVTVTENESTDSRTGTVTFTQDPGGDNIVRTLTVVQDGAELTELYDLINTGVEGEDPVIITFFTEEEVNGVDKFNYVANTLDKNNNSVWAADDDAILPGDYKGDGEYIIYDLGSIYDLDLIQFTTTNKSDPFGYQIWVSTTGTDQADFTMVLPTTGDLLLTATNTTDFNQYLVDTQARFVKLWGYGRFNSAGDTRTSPWSAIGEIEFFGTESLSIDESELQDHISLYPNPVSSDINIKVKNGIGIDYVQFYSLDGKLIMNNKVDSSNFEFSLDISGIGSGSCILTLLASEGSKFSKLIVKE